VRREAVKSILRRASKEEMAALRAFNIPAIQAINGYHPKVAKDLKDSFWDDAAVIGLGSAVEKWQWLIKKGGANV